MDSDIWLPLATLVLGWAGAQATELFRDRRVSNRERLARRAELQRATLLELQDALLELSRRAGDAWYRAFIVTVDEGTDEEAKQEAAFQASLRLGETTAKVKLLASRVEDEQVRKLATGFIGVSAYVDHRDEDTADKAVTRINRAYVPAIDRIGELLRERY